jgi:uroporphyrinogen III methyltransferase/synthase
MKGKRVLLPRTDIAREELRDGLRALGAHVTEVTTYLTRTALSPDPAVVEAVRAGRCDVVAFTSPSTVKGFVEIIGADSVRALAGRVKFASIGPVTTREAEALGLAVDIEAADHTAAGLARAIRDKSSGPALT